MTVPPQLLALLPQSAREQIGVNGGRLCLSGAARGADALWGELARQAGHAVVHWSFEGHRRDPAAGELVELAPEQLATADPALATAAGALGRRWPPRSAYAAKLLRRDYFQAAWNSALYAVADLERRGRISGGTAWAAQIFIERFAGQACPAYLFDQRQRHWAAWEGAGWTSIASPPPPDGIWAGIGSRSLAPEGAAAIRELLDAA
jgi:hypothetical protein